MNVKLGYLALREYEDICNQVLSTAFGSEMEKVTGSWRKLHNGELRNCYSSSFSLHDSVTKAFCGFTISVQLFQGLPWSPCPFALRHSVCIGVLTSAVLSGWFVQSCLYNFLFYAE
jgi:hypothetical protein